MATAIGPVRSGFPRANAATAHEEMKRLRNMLLAVGLEELQTPESYDASEDSDESDIPTAEGGSSKYMYFAFTDPAQAEAPIYIGIRVKCDKYFNTSSSTVSRVMEVMVSRVLEDGIPSDSGAVRSFPPGGYSTSTSNRGLLTNRTSQGDYAAYFGGTLFVAFGVNAQQQTNEGNGPQKCSLFLIISRVGQCAVVVLDRRGTPREIDRVLHGANSTISYNVPYMPALPAILSSPFSNVYHNDERITERSGGVLFDGGVPVIAPVYGYDEYGAAHPLEGIYTIPSGSQLSLSTGQTMKLDFTGEEKDYLYVYTPSVVPSSHDQGWLIEWR